MYGYGYFSVAAIARKYSETASKLQWVFAVNPLEDKPDWAMN
jgi:hypothetical protein